METAAFKQYKIYHDETDCYGWNVDPDCTRVSTLYEHGCGGMHDKAVPLMRKNMDTDETDDFKPNDCLGWSVDNPAGCGGCFYTDDGGQTFETFPYLYKVDNETKKTKFYLISDVWHFGKRKKNYVEYNILIDA
jgi:hypothetical protein